MLKRTKFGEIHDNEILRVNPKLIKFEVLHKQVVEIQTRINNSSGNIDTRTLLDLQLLKMKVDLL